MVQNIKLVKKEPVAHETMAFHFTKPEGFTFRAGQFADLTLIAPPETDAEGNTRGFSIVAAPYETELVFATRLRDTAFKQVLRSLPVGAEVKLDAPYGDFTLHKTETTPAVFLIGGIGITPVRSMVAQATHDRTADRLARENSNFTFVPVLTAAVPEGWHGEHGRIDEAMLKRHISDLNAPIYYLSGPEGMVKAMRQLLVGVGVNEDNIKTEEFTGY
jgi:ferredoxin-NADP reductase